VRREGRIERVALLPQDVVGFTGSAMQLVAGLHTVESNLRPWESRDRRLEIPFTASCLAHLMLVQLLVVVETKIVVVSPKTVAACFTRLPELFLRFEGLGGVDRLLLTNLRMSTNHQ